MSVSINGTSGLVFNDASTQATAATGFGFKNRIINGAMVIDQRNAGASVTPTLDGYSIDRWQHLRTQASKFSIQQNAGSVTPPTGFSNYLGVTSTSSYSVISTDYFIIQQNIEGFNCADLAFGTANASTITLSFWVRSSLTGTFSGNLANGGAPDRFYPFNYIISSANTWEQKTVTIAGDTTGTWLTNNGKGLRVLFMLGAGSNYNGTVNQWGSTAGGSSATSVVGTNGATFYITGVQLEKGSTATSFDYRPYGTELALCQRYYQKFTSAVNGDPFGVGGSTATTAGRAFTQFIIPMRTSPTALETNGTASDYSVLQGSGAIVCSAVPTFTSATPYGGQTSWTVASGATVGFYAILRSATTNGAYLAWSSEL